MTRPQTFRTMILRKFGLATILFFAQISFSAPQPHPAGFPTIACRDAWKKIAHAYDYASDARPGAPGNEGYLDFAQRVNRKDCFKPWTVLVYVAADNDLAPYAFMDLYEMEAGFVAPGAPKVGSTLRSDLVVQLDTDRSRTIRRLHMFQTPEAYRRDIREEDFKNSVEGDVKSPIVMSFPEDAARAPKEDLEEFLRWGVREYPAEQYMVIVWGHGQGWRAVSPGGFGGLAFDNTDGSYLSIPDLSEVLGKISRQELSGNLIDVYASDACLMQMFEVAYEMARNTRYVVGSTQVQNFLGLPYRRLMTELNTGYFGERTRPQGDEAFLLARMIPKVFKASMQPRGLQGRIQPRGIETITMSTLNSSELRHQLAPALIDLSQTLRDYLMEDAIRAIDLQFAMQNAPAFAGGAQDLGGFLTMVSNLVSLEWREAGELSPVAERLQRKLGTAHEALNRSVNALALGTKYSAVDEQLYLLGMRGLSIWLPTTPEDFELRSVDFGKSDFYRQSVQGKHWSAWLEQIYVLNQ